MSRRPYEYLLSLGSNVDRGASVAQALRLLRARFEVIALSPVYDAPAVGLPGAPPFVNMGIRLRSDLPPASLRVALRRLEEACGRRRGSDRFAPRPLDLDVVFAAPGVPGAEALPHPDLLREAYVLWPCAAAWPRARLPAGELSLHDLALRDFPTWERDHRVPRDESPPESHDV